MFKVKHVIYKDTEQYGEWVTISDNTNQDILWELIRDAAKELQQAFEDTAKDRGKNILEAETKIIITMKDDIGFTRVGIEGTLYRYKVVEV